MQIDIAGLLFTGPRADANDANSRATHRPQWSYSGKLEFSIWMIPLLIVLFLNTLAWSGAHELDPYKPYTTIENSRPPLTVAKGLAPRIGVRHRR